MCVGNKEESRGYITAFLVTLYRNTPAGWEEPGGKRGGDNEKGIRSVNQQGNMLLITKERDALTKITSQLTFIRTLF